MRLAPFILVLSLLTGCIPWPHRTWRSQEISGKVLDERTHAPIQDAKICLTEHPSVFCLSGADGSYRLKPTYNWHVGYSFTPPESFDVPRQTVWWPRVTLSHSNYISREIDWGAHHPDVILLKRVGESPTIRPWLIFNGSGKILHDMGAAKYLKPGDIRIVDRHKEEMDTRPSMIQIGFVQRVYDPQVTPVYNPDKAGIETWELNGLDWKFRINYWFWSDKINDIKDASRTYKLEFIP